MGIQWKLADHLTLAVLMQRIGRAGRKASIAAVSILFVEAKHLFPKGVATLSETVVENGETKTTVSKFRERTMPVLQANESAIEKAISNLYAGNMQIRKEKGLSAYHKVDPSLLWYVNTTGCRMRLVLAFSDIHTGNPLCCDVCLFQKAAENNVSPMFSLHDATPTHSMLYLDTPEWKQSMIDTALEKAS